MMVVLVSQCEKNALAKTRRVLDAFADRIGDNTWQTVITEEGLQAVHKLLRKTASKSTAVSCHWIRSRSRSDLLWVVGNKKKFNAQGIVPVNYTEANLEQYIDKESWQSLNTIKCAAAIAALFHDFGKATVLFQRKLRGDTKNAYDPVRHEWVSLRIFQAFVAQQSDEEWLTALTEIDRNHADEMYKDGCEGFDNNPLKDLPPFAQLVGWLILSHHKLPLVPCWKTKLQERRETSLKVLAKNNISLLASWFENDLNVCWNSYNFMDEDSPDFISDNWAFHEDGLPYKSTKWRLRAIREADTALQNLKWMNSQNLLHGEVFTSHIARMVLMLADHHYSAQEEVTVEWQSPGYSVYANTVNKTKELKQQLDEHLIGVSSHAVKIANALPRFKLSLPALEDNAFLKSTKVVHDKFAWQVEAQKAVLALGESHTKQPFFGISMASTGTGKTLANAKIMYALANKEVGSRFTVALGLRTLTLQTGDVYRKELTLTKEQLAIAVGGTAAKALFENEQSKQESLDNFGTGSASAEGVVDPDLFLDYDSIETEHSLYPWTKGKPQIEKLLQAPVLVCTIDHLIPATDGTQGGRQIAPMLRLLTSDLVIDEPDDFGLEDLPALCRLVYWAGMLGSRVLLSTATMPPDLAFAAFLAYQAGWAEYAKVNVANWDKKITCSWFDERKNGVLIEEIQEFAAFKTTHEKYVEKRVKYLTQTALPKHKANLLQNSSASGSRYRDFAATVLQGALTLHKANHVELEDKRISIGLVRMANIDPMVATAKELIKSPLDEDMHIHLCVYHSRYPLGVRSYLEKQLDKMLYRKDDWPPEDLQDRINKTAAKNQIFIVLASPVAEVGRDHDYDWAVIEPSSMRSIIQIAGRVLRHRDDVPSEENILLINQNVKNLQGRERCFIQPGFEVKNLELKLKNHRLDEVLVEAQYQEINAIERVVRSTFDFQENLVALEHRALLAQLFHHHSSAKLWWKEQAHWCGALQQLQPFRKSKKDESVLLLFEDDELQWRWRNERATRVKIGALAGAGLEIHEDLNIDMSHSFSFCFDLNPLTIYEVLAEDFQISCEEASLRFGELRLISYAHNDTNVYKYFANLGVYREVK